MSASTSPDGNPRMAKPRATLALPLILVVFLLGMLSIALRSGDPSRLPSALIGKPVPDFDLPGIPRLLSDFGPVPGLSSRALKTGRVTLLNVWASWCTPCVAEHPQLVALSERGIPLYGINYKGDTLEAAKRFLARNGNPFRAIGVDATGMTAIDFGVYGVPETFVIDGRGRIAYRFPGPLTEEVVAGKILPAIKKAERENVPPRS
jgi:cytochrome c biogenesis protein CcmG, thiol:disulfide interchange protein DsbE